MNFDNSIKKKIHYKTIFGSIKWPHFDDFGNIYCFYVVISITYIIVFPLVETCGWKEQLPNLLENWFLFLELETLNFGYLLIFFIL